MTSSALAEISTRLAAGDAITEEDIQTLAATSDLVALGMIAEGVRERKHQRRITFVRVFDVPAMASTSAAQVPDGAGEVRLTGVVDDLGAALRHVRAVSEAARGLPVSGFSLADLEDAARDRSELDDTLTALREAGLELIAEAPIDRLRGPEAALEAVGRAGLGLARLTVHAAAGAERLDLVRRAGRLHASFGWLRAFAPLPRGAADPYASTGYDDVKLVAMARIMLDIDTIQVDWTQDGPKLAQVALTFGADDLDNVSPFDTENLGLRRTALEEVRRNIQAASLEPVERNARFQAI